MSNAVAVREDLMELSKIYEKLKKMCQEMKELRDRKKKIEENLITYIQETEEVGLKCGSFIFFPKDKKVRKKLKKKEREEVAVQVLEDYGANNPKEAYEKMMDALKGEESVVPVIKVSEQKDD
jgi:chaperonin cofactor prefoldin